MKRIILAAPISILLISCGGEDSSEQEVPTQIGTTDIYYENCEQAGREIKKGEPGYREELDRNSDGIACESS